LYRTLLIGTITSTLQGNKRRLTRFHEPTRLRRDGVSLRRALTWQHPKAPRQVGTSVISGCVHCAPILSPKQIQSFQRRQVLNKTCTLVVTQRMDADVGDYGEWFWPIS